MEFAIPIGTSVSLFKTLYHVITKIKRNRRLRGFYRVHYQNRTTPVVTSPEQIPNFLKLDIKWYDPDRLIIRSKDYDRAKLKKWKTWVGKITLYSDDYGNGWYKYLEGDEPGNHEIWPDGDGSIIVRVVDKGKAHPREYRDNDPATQKWVRVKDRDQLIRTFEKMLEA